MNLEVWFLFREGNFAVVGGPFYSAVESVQIEVVIAEEGWAFGGGVVVVLGRLEIYETGIVGILSGEGVLPVDAVTFDNGRLQQRHLSNCESIEKSQIDVSRKTLFRFWEISFLLRTGM